MPTSFGEPIPSPSSRFPLEHTSALPFHQGQVELEELTPPSRQSLQSRSQSERPVNLREQTQQENSRSARKYRPPPISVPRPTELSTSHLASPSSFSDSDDESTPMGRKSPKAQSQEAEQPTSTALGSPNGTASGSMESHLEMRRKHPVLESPGTSSQTAHLMGREGFSLDDEIPPTPLTPNSNASFFDLPRKDRRNFLLLVLLYFLQGIPMGLASGSVPFLLKPYLSYGQIGVFSLASYPYSLKLLWSPIVDAVWSPALGRRKSWILPIQLCSGFGMIYLGSRIKDMMVAAGKSDGSGVWNFTGWWFFLVFLCATQDIAVDGRSYSGCTCRTLAEIAFRMGAHFVVSTKSFLCVYGPDGWTDRWSLSLLYCVPRFQRTRFRQQVVPLHPSSRRGHDTWWLPHILGLGVPSSNARSCSAQA